MADKERVRFHIAGVITVLLGTAGAFLSLFWDVIYRGRAFSMSAFGPYKLIGLAAGLALIVAGVIAGLVLGRRAAARAGTGDIPSPVKAYKLIGLLLLIGGFGGTFLSLLWDVIRRGRPFSAAAIGPMKMMGAAAGMVLVVIGIVMVLILARKKQAAPAQVVAVPTPTAAMAPQQTVSVGAQQQQPAQAYDVYPSASAGAQTQEEIPFALAIEEVYPAQTGAEPMEAIPIEEAPDDENARPA